MAEPFLAELRMFSMAFPPRGWALCNGQLLPINQNQALFSLLGTTYGGDGRVNFALPDLRGRVPIHMGSGYSLGQSGGEQAHTLSISELPAHTHQVGATTQPAVLNTPDGALWSAPAVSAYHDGGATTAMSSNAVTNIGGNQAHLNMQPFLTISYCIALQGIFPSQN